MHSLFTRISTCCAYYVGHPTAFILSILMCLAWLISGPFFKWSDTWQLLINTPTTVITYLLLFILQAHVNRMEQQDKKDTKAIQLKLDELIKAVERASNNLIGAEHKSMEELKKAEIAILDECGPEPDLGTEDRS